MFCKSLVKLCFLLKNLPKNETGLPSSIRPFQKTFSEKWLRNDDGDNIHAHAIALEVCNLGKVRFMVFCAHHFELSLGRKHVSGVNDPYIFLISRNPDLRFRSGFQHHPKRSRAFVSP